MIRRANSADSLVVASLAARLWTDSSVSELSEEFENMLSGTDNAAFIYYADEVPVGFASCSLRTDYVEGAETSPVGYLEGVFVAEPYRGRGYARSLVYACEQWAKDMGCAEFASDCELDNIQSLAFHLRTGFSEANRIICFTKRI